MSDVKVKQSDTENLVRDKISELISFREEDQDIKEFWGKQFDLGLAWVQFPEGAGGLGVNPKYQLLVIEELRKEFLLDIEEVEIVKENITFKIPGKLN